MRRTNEIGICMALGATRIHVLRMIVGESFVLVAAGIVICVPVARGLARLIESRLYGLGSADPLTVAGAIALMIVVAAVAGGFPAVRASRVDPTTALRHE